MLLWNPSVSTCVALLAEDKELYESRGHIATELPASHYGLCDFQEEASTLGRAPVMGSGYNKPPGEATVDPATNCLNPGGSASSCPFPKAWYKEKLSCKCFGRHSKATFSGSLNSQCWRFLKNGLDDFRSGVPAPSDNIIIRGPKGPLPIVLPNNVPDASRGAQQKAGKMFARQFRLSPLQKARQDHIARTEYCLSQHPLVLYPHLKESISPELFEELVAILDPEMCLHSEAGDKDRDWESHTPQQVLDQLEDGTSKEISLTSSTLLKQMKSKNPYLHFSKKEVAAREKAAMQHYVPPLDENVKRATKEFCDWVASWGGESYNIEEDTIMRLFDAGYETKPTLAKTVEVVEITNVPLELKQCLEFSLSPKVVRSLSKGLYQPKWEKFRYGAWYLDPKTWRKLKANEPLEDPKVAAERLLKLRKRFSEKDPEAVQLHGTHAFNEFLEKKGYRKPEFLLQMLAVKDAKGVKEETSKDFKKTQRGRSRISSHTR